MTSPFFNIEACQRVLGKTAAAYVEKCNVKPFVAPEEVAHHLIILPPVMSLKWPRCIVGSVGARLLKKNSTGLTLYSHNTWTGLIQQNQGYCLFIPTLPTMQQSHE